MACDLDPLFNYSITKLPNYQILRLLIYQILSAFAGSPGVDAAGPEEEALFVVANLLDDFGFIRQMHGANGFMAERRSGAHKRCRPMLYALSVQGVGVAQPRCP